MQILPLCEKLLEYLEEEWNRTDQQCSGRLTAHLEHLEHMAHLGSLISDIYTVLQMQCSDEQDEVIAVSLQSIQNELENVRRLTFEGLHKHGRKRRKQASEIRRIINQPQSQDRVQAQAQDQAQDQQEDEREMGWRNTYMIASLALYMLDWMVWRENALHHDNLHTYKSMHNIKDDRAFKSIKNSSNNIIQTHESRDYECLKQTKESDGSKTESDTSSTIASIISTQDNTSKLTHLEHLRKRIRIVDQALLLGGIAFRQTANQILDELVLKYREHAVVQPTFNSISGQVGGESIYLHEVLPPSYLTQPARVRFLMSPLVRLIRPSLQQFTNEFNTDDISSQQPVVLCGCMEAWPFRQDPLHSTAIGVNRLQSSYWTPFSADEACNPIEFKSQMNGIVEWSCSLVEIDYQIYDSEDDNYMDAKVDTEIDLEIDTDMDVHTHMGANQTDFNSAENLRRITCSQRISWFDPTPFIRNPEVSVRIVPVEVGKHYLEETWTKSMMHFDEFLAQCVISTTKSAGEHKSSDCGYLAQHDVFDRIPFLRQGISIPDYCTVSCEESLEVNVWIGPQGTITPLHTDPKHNLLCQVAGFKYIRVYSPLQTNSLYPCPEPELHNTSQIVDFLTPSDMAKLPARFPGFLEAPFLETILRPGEMLYIPKGWWHYVESLTPSFSVSFWWDK